MLFSCSAMFDSLWPHGLQYARLPSRSPGAYSNSCPSSQWCHPTISFSVALFSSCHQSFPASGSFLMSRLFTSCGQSMNRVISSHQVAKYRNFSLSISPSNEYLGLIFFKIDLLSVQGTLKSLLQHHTERIKASVLSLLYGSALTSIHDYWGNYTFDYTDFVDKVVSLLFNILSMFVITWLPSFKNLVCTHLSWGILSMGSLEKKSWQLWDMLKNWCFWIVVLKKTLESPLDCKEIQPVHPKGNQSWMLIGRTDAEAETPILWPLDAKSWLIWKDPDTGKDWRQEVKGVTEDEMVGWHHRLNGHEFE